MTAKNRRPGTKKVYADERRRWLEAYESGTSLPILAGKTGRNIRTIKKQVEAARDERERALARTDLYRQALIRHNEDLLSTLRAVRDSLVVPPEDRFTTLAHYSQSSSATGVKPLVRIVDGEAHVALVEGEEAERLLTLAREHMQRDRDLWSKLDDWKKKLEGYAGLCYKLGENLGDHAVQETGLGFIRVEQGVADGLHSGFIAILCRRAIERALSVLDSKRSDEAALAVVGSHLRYGDVTIATGGSQERLRAVKTSYLKLLDVLKEAPEARKIEILKRDLERAAPGLRGLLGDALLIGMVGGRCAVCRRLER